MSNYAGYGGSIVFTAGSLTELKSWQFDEKATQVETTSMSNAATGSVAKTYLPTTHEYSGQFVANYNPGDAVGEELVGNFSDTVKVYPQGTTAGFKYWTGTIIVDSVSSKATVDGVIEKTVNWKGSGAFTRQTA